MTDGELLIDECRYVPDWSLYARAPLESDVQIQDAGAEPSELSLSRFGWKRTQTDFILGAGQEWFDQEDESNRRRFWRSRNLTMSRRGTISNSPQMEEQGLRLTENSHYYSAGRRGYWYATDAIHEVTDEGEQRRTVTGLPENLIVHDVTSLSGLAYIATQTGVYRQSVAGGDAVGRWSNEVVTNLVEATGRLLGMHRNELWEFNAQGGKLGGRNIWLHADTNFHWRGAAPAPNGIYVWGDDQSKTEIYLLVATDATGEFAAPYSVASWPIGEMVNAIIEYGGLLVIATTRGVRLATISGSGFLSYGPVLEFDGGVPALTARGEDVFFPANNQSIAGVQYSGVGRLGLARFTSTLVPTWEFFVDNDDNDKVVDVGTIYSATGIPRLVWLQNDGVGSHMRLEVDATGAIESAFETGKITYGTPEPKAFLSFEIEGYTPVAGKVEVDIRIDGRNHPLEVKLEGRVTTCTSTDKLVGNEYQIIIKPKAAFTMDRWTLRAFVLPEQVEVIEVGVILETSATGTSTLESHDPYADWSKLQKLAETHEIIELQTGDRIDRGYIDAVIASEERIKDVLGSGKRGSFVQGTWIIRFITSTNA